MRRGPFYHGGKQGMRVGARLRDPAHVTTSMGIAAFYAATVPDGWLYEVSVGRVQHDAQFNRQVPCYIADTARIVRVVRVCSIIEVEKLTGDER